MASATESLQHAAELSRIAEELETGLQSRIREFEAEAATAREAFEQEIRGERAKVREARQEAAAAIRRAAQAMGDGGTPPAPRAARSRGSLDGDTALRLLAEAGADGLNGVQVAQQAGVSAPTARKVLDALVADGAARTEGQRRGKKFYVA